MASSSSTEVPDLTGRLAVVTGASDGIGLAIAGRLAAAGCELILPVRNPVKGDAKISSPPFGLASLHNASSPCELAPVFCRSQENR
jgi:NAD(P)-dependent dehydrogenase (short-subunit alcohol dehydrogenase family)